MMPPRECFRTDDVAGVQINNRLVPGDDLAAAQRDADVVFLVEATYQRVTELTIEHLDAVSALLFRLVLGGIGVREQRVSVIGWLQVRGDTNTRGDVHRTACD